MTRPLLLLALLAALAGPAAAQTCASALDRAEASYQSGEFDAAIERLTTCLDQGALSPEERRQAYRLVGLSYIGKDREADARDAVVRLLEVAPNYQPDPALDPPPFVRLVEEMRRQRPDLRPTTAPATLAAGGRTGFFGAVRVHGMGYSDSDADTYSGGGGDLTLGVAVTPALAVYAVLSGAAGTGGGVDLALGGVALGGRLQLGRGRLVPFVGAAAAYQTATFSAGGLSVDYDGPGGEVEGGLVYGLTPSLSLDAGLAATVTTLGTALRADDVTATTVRLGVGLRWQP